MGSYILNIMSMLRLGECEGIDDVFSISFIAVSFLLVVLFSVIIWLIKLPLKHELLYKLHSE